MTNREVVNKFFNHQLAHSSNKNLFTREDGDRFELVNYNTVIAFIKSDVVYFNTRKYSSTTSAIQSLILEIGEDYSWKFNFKPYTGRAR